MIIAIFICLFAFYVFMSFMSTSIYFDEKYNIFEKKSSFEFTIFIFLCMIFGWILFPYCLISYIKEKCKRGKNERIRID